MTVLVRGLRFHSHHGVTELERDHGQWLEVDVSAEVRTVAGTTDLIADTVDYVVLAELMVETSRATKAHTLEFLAAAFADRALAKWPGIETLVVEIRKPNPLLHLTTQSIGVREQRSRSRESNLAPWLTVSAGGSAVAFYEMAFGATTEYRMDFGDELVARLRVGDSAFWVADGEPVPGPERGSVRMVLTVADPAATLSAALDAGADKLSDVQEEHGWMVGRIRDPFGHHWEIGRPSMS